MIQNNFNNKISLCKFENDDKLDRSIIIPLIS